MKDFSQYGLLTRTFGDHKISREAILVENRRFFSFLTPDQELLGASLIVPYNKLASVTEFTQVDWLDFGKMLNATTGEISNRYKQVAGFNIGWNVNLAAGQTIPHCHCHIIPRYNSNYDKALGKGIKHALKKTILGVTP